MFTLNIVTRSRRVEWRDVSDEFARSPDNASTTAVRILESALADIQDIVDADVCFDHPYGKDMSYKVLAYWHAGRVLAGDWRDAEGL